MQDIDLNKVVRHQGEDGLRQKPSKKNEKYQDNHMAVILQKLFGSLGDWCADPHLRDASGAVIRRNGGKSYIQPDFCNYKLKLIIEIDGDAPTQSRYGGGHFSDEEKAINDNQKDEIYKEQGFEVIHIPYFVQLDEAMVNFYFGKYGVSCKDKLYKNADMHGFLHPKCSLPVSFAPTGIKNFEKIMASIPTSVRDKIIETLKVRINKFEDEGFDTESATNKVLPQCLRYLIK